MSGTVSNSGVSWYGRPYSAAIARTSGAIFRCIDGGRSGKRWCSTWVSRPP